MSSYMWNPAYYLNQTEQVSQYTAIPSTVYSSPLNSSHETDLSRSTSTCNSSYLESSSLTPNAHYSSSFNNRQPIQSDLESSYLLNNYNQQQNQHLSYSPETKYTQNYFEHNDQYKLSYQNYYGFSNSSSSISNRPEPTNYFSSYQSQENILQPARFNTYPSNRQDSSVLTSTGNYYNNNLSPVMPVKTSKIVSEEKLSKNSTGTKQIENPKANKNVKVKMQDMDIWSEFNQVGTEMIVTKSGRRMFPALRVSVSGLNSSAKYNMIIDVVPADDDRYKYQSGKWIVNGRADVHFSGRGYLHPDGPLTGNQWMKHIVSFHKLKITNNAFDRAGHIILNSMQKYVPRIHLIETEGKSVNTFVLSEATFMAVTAYQNEMITKLKIAHNPFAKGFRELQTKKDLQTKRHSDEQMENYQKIGNYSIY